MMCRRDRPPALTSAPVGRNALVVMTSSSRLPAMSLPRIVSDAPAPYALAVSKKLMPASRQRANISAEVASSASAPNDIVPKHNGDTDTPVPPTVTYSIAYSLPIVRPSPPLGIQPHAGG